MQTIILIVIISIALLIECRDDFVNPMKYALPLELPD